MAWAEALLHRKAKHGMAAVRFAGIVACVLLYGASSAFGQNESSAPVLLTRPAPAPATTAPRTQPFTIDLTTPQGTPLRVSLTKKVRIWKVGAPITARVLESVYAFDRIVVPKGSVVTGKVIEIVPVPKLVRTEAILNGDFTPLKRVKIEFDTLILKNGARMPLDTQVQPGTPDVIRLVAQQNNKKPSLIEQAKQAIDQRWRNAIDEVKDPGRLHRLKQMALSELPYHRQYLKAGTVFDAVLTQPLDFGKARISPAELAAEGQVPPQDGVVDARLLTALSSATAVKGAPVKAIVTKPLFSTKDKTELLLPQGTQLEGDVVQARPARHWDRNGQLRFVIRKMELPSRTWNRVDASVEGLEVGRGADLKLDSEGGASVTKSKRRFLTTALSLAIAATTVAGDSDHHMGDVKGSIGSGDAGKNGLAGASGFRLVGLALGVGVQSRAFAAALGFYGAARSVYHHFIARGRNVELAKNTPMEIAFGPPLGPAVK
jgi:hypothetical protein